MTRNTVGGAALDDAQRSRTFIADLLAILGRSGLIDAPEEMTPYTHDWWGTSKGNALAVARPANTNQVAEVVARCAREGIAIVPQGGNTGLCGGATPDASGQSVVIVLDRMANIRELDAFNQTLTVDAGCTLLGAQQAAQEAGFLFPLSLGSEGTCQIGGNISTNAGGTAVLRYGNMRDLVLGIEAVLPDGQIWNGLRGLRKDNTGYDLKQLFIGAEGTLGIVTGAVLKLFPRTRASATAWVGLAQMEDAVALLGHMRSACGECITSFEVCSRSQLDLVYRHIPQTRDPLGSTHPWVVLIELGDMGGDAALAHRLEDALGSALEFGYIDDVAIASNDTQAKAIWHIRHSVSEANVREGKSVSHDIAVPLSRMADFVREAHAALADHAAGAHILTVGHAGDGNLHFIAVFPHACWSALSVDTQVMRARAITATVQHTALSMGGSISAEHGIGRTHRDELRHAKSALELDLMRAVKAALDPRHLMNPEKVL